MSRANDDRREWRNEGLVYPKGADLTESPAGPRGFAERATRNGGMGDAPLAAALEVLPGRPLQVLVQDAGTV
jgi:hypothetical protein